MDTWNYQPLGDLDQTLLERLKRFPREPDMLCYGVRSISALAVRTWLACYHRFTILGQENLPGSGPFVLVCNHSSHLDALCLLSAVPLRRLHQAFPAAAEDYFFVNLPRLVLSATVINALPFNRHAHSRQSLALCRHLLDEGNVLILFPEGTRSGTGRIGTFRPGIGLLLAGTAIPAIPCCLVGTNRGLPKGALLPRPARITLVIGQPKQYRDRRTDKESVLEICRDLQASVERLRAPFNSDSTSGPLSIVRCPVPAAEPLTTDN